MKKNYFTRLVTLMFACSMLVLLTFTACNDDDDEDPGPEYDEVTAVFSYEASGNTVTFVNASVNAETYAWDFGDGETSTDENPVHEYDSPGSYTVKLTASNPEYSDEATEEVLTENAGPIASKLVGKTWIAARGEVFSYALGPVSSGDFIAGETWDDSNPPWWNWGDGPGHSFLRDRPSLYNDEYVFNVDGTYTVDFKGDFWGEYGLWTDTEFNETDITIGSGLPANIGGTDMSAFAAGEWEWIVDEDNSLITVKGDGAHILNPRVINAALGGGASHNLTPIAESSYEVIRIVEGEKCDTLVIFATCNDGANDIAQYITMHSYHNSEDVPEPTPAPCEIQRLTGSVKAADFTHTFLAEDGMGSGMASLNEDYTATYDAEMDGQKCTKFEIQNDAAPYGNIMMRGGASGECEDQSEYWVESIDFENDEYVVKFDIYIPSEGNDFDGTNLANIVTVRWVDESQYAQFWEHYLLINKENLDLNTWLSLEYDFSTNAEALYAGDGNKYSLKELIDNGKNIPDALHIDFGGDNHVDPGVFYIKNFRLEAAP